MDEWTGCRLTVDWISPPPAPWQANTGGPRSRTRTERIHSTILGGEGPIQCPRVVRIGIEFAGRDPLSVTESLLLGHGIASPEELRCRFDVPIHPAVCRLDANPAPVDVGGASDDEVLYHALLLGLCTPWLYDPARPVIWTRASLTRRLELFEGGGFYA